MFNTKKIAWALIGVICLAGLVIIYQTLTYTDDDFIQGGDIQKSISTQQN